MLVLSILTAVIAAAVAAPVPEDGKALEAAVTRCAQARPGDLVCLRFTKFAICPIPGVAPIVQTLGAGDNRCDKAENVVKPIEH